MTLSWQQRLSNALYQVKFANNPGMHNNGEYDKELTVNEALDRVAKLMGVKVPNPKPLYWIENGRLYSRITSRFYDVVQIDNEVKVKYQHRWYGCENEREAMNFINYKEVHEPPTTQVVRDGEYEYYA